jgi:hypothetical protein
MDNQETQAISGVTEKDMDNPETRAMSGVTEKDK